MKRTNRFLTAAALLILAAVAAYTVAYIWHSTHTVHTATAVAATVKRVGHAKGILVRDEMVIDGGDDVTVIVAETENVLPQEVRLLSAARGSPQPVPGSFFRSWMVTSI